MPSIQNSQEVDSETRRAFTDRKLNVRQRLFQVISVILLIFVGYEVYLRNVSWWEGVLAIVVGLIIGFIMGRLVRIRWDAEAQRVVTHMDIVGVIVIVLYIGVAILRDELLGRWLSGNALTAISLAVVAGILYGRYLGMRRSIRRVIQKNMPQGV